MNLLENILTDLINRYWSYSDEQIDTILFFGGIEIKDQVGRVNNMKVVIYSNDHNPPHFHVISNDKKIDVKFTIEKCELISGHLDTKNLRRIKAFYESDKVKIVMQKIWSKRNEQNGQ